MYKPNDVVVNGQRIPNIFNTSDLAFHAKYSNPIRPFWSMTQVLELEPYIDETLNDVVGELQWRFADSQGSLCSMEDWLAYYTWDTAANMSFGSKFGFLKQGRDVDGMIAESTAGLRYFAPVSQMPWVDEWLDKNPVWRIGPRPLVNGVMTTIRLINEYQQESARDEAKPRKAPNFFDKYSTLKGKLDFVDDAQVVNWIMLNVLAGGDSTAGALRSFIYHVSRSPAAREALVAELDDAQVSLPAQWREIKDLGYLDAAGLEAQRLTPAVGLMLEREVPAAGFELPDGRVVPAGTKVGINPCVITRDVGVFGEDVAAYRPERWLRHQDETEEAFVQRRRRMFDATDLMYGAGNRICMGKHLAKMMMYKLVATLFVAFDVSRCSPCIGATRVSLLTLTLYRSSLVILIVNGTILTPGSCTRLICP